MKFHSIGESTLCDKPLKYFIVPDESLLEIDCCTLRQIRIVEILLKRLNLKIHKKENDAIWHYISVHTTLDNIRHIVNVLGNNDDIKTIDSIIEDYVLNKLQE